MNGHYLGAVPDSKPETRRHNSGIVLEGGSEIHDPRDETRNGDAGGAVPPATDLGSGWSELIVDDRTGEALVTTPPAVDDLPDGFVPV